MEIPLWIQLPLATPLFLLLTIGLAACAGEVDYLVVFLPQVLSHTANGTNLLEISAESETLVSMEIPMHRRKERFTIQAGEVKSFHFKSDFRSCLHEFKSFKSVHIRASSRVSVTGYNIAESSTDSFQAVPITSDFTRFRTVSYTETYVRPKCLALITSLYGRNVVKITSTKTSSFQYEQRFYSHGETLRVSLDRLQVVQIESSDVTGLLVTSYSPVAVYSGCMCVSVPRSTDNCDHMVEQIPPISMWGVEYISAPMTSRPSGEIFRVLPACKGTNVHIGGTPRGSVDPGNYLEYARSSSEPVWITCSNPCLVTMFLRGDVLDNRRGDPAMVVLPDVSQYVTSAIISPRTLRGGNQRVKHSFNSVVHYFMLITKSPNTVGILLDGRVLGAGRPWTPVRGTDYSVTTFRAAPGLHRIKHINRKSTFGILSYGLGVQLAYAHTPSLNTTIRLRRGCKTTSAELAPANIVNGGQPVERVRIQTDYAIVVPLAVLSSILFVVIGFLVFVVLRLRDQLRRFHDQHKVIIVPRPSLPSNQQNILEQSPTSANEQTRSEHTTAIRNPAHYLELLNDTS